MNKKGQITLAMLVGGFSLVASVLGFSGYFNGKIENTNEKVSELRADISAIRTDIVWIREFIEKNDKQGKNLLIK